MKGREILNAAADFVLPRLCVVCGCRLNQGEKYLCLNCFADVPLTRFWVNAHNPMADKFNGIIQKRIEEGLLGKESYIFASALFFYSSSREYKNIQHQIKYHGNIPLAGYFGHIMGERMSQNIIWSDVDAVIPVPLHWTRRWNRGYNQAELLAAALADSLGASLCSDVLLRRRRTQTQTKLELGEKAGNVSGAFAVNTEAAFSARHILLVDDIFTTGSTLAECFTVLRQSFQEEVRISIATLGYVI